MNRNYGHNFQIERTMTLKYSNLAQGTRDRLMLDLLGLIAPERDRSRQRSWRWFSKLMPRLWLRPRALCGLRLLIDPTDWSQILIFDEIFLHNNYDLRRLQFVPSAIVDCGAHIGMFSLLAAATFPQARLFAFEPNPANVNMIRRQVRANVLGLTLFDAAVSSTGGVRTFIIGNSHSGRLSAPPNPADKGITVSAIDLPDFMAQLRADALLLKMDVEGEEETLIPALLPQLPKRCAIFFETHSAELGWQSTTRHLAVNGFSVEQINSRGKFADGYACRG